MQGLSGVEGGLRMIARIIVMVLITGIPLLVYNYLVFKKSEPKGKGNK